MLLALLFIPGLALKITREFQKQMLNGSAFAAPSCGTISVSKTEPFVDDERHRGLLFVLVSDAPKHYRIANSPVFVRIFVFSCNPCQNRVQDKESLFFIGRRHWPTIHPRGGAPPMDAETSSDPQWLRERAEQCFRLAARMFNEADAQRIIELGRRFEAEAERLERPGAGVGQLKVDQEP